MESSDRCNVCGDTNLKLLDGFYYCNECGTQNTNVRETILEEKVLADGTFAQSSKKRIVHLKEDGIEMSGEWYRWHAFNFIISGLADDLIKLGASPTFKTKLHWLWVRYIKKYQNKDELMKNKSSLEGKDQTVFPSFMVEEDSNLEAEEVEPPEEEISKKGNKYDIPDGSKRDIRFLSKGLIVAMLYVALNLDESDIQLSHLFRFLKEKQLDIYNLNRFLPEDIIVKKIPQWTNFLRSKLCTQHQIRVLAMSLLRKLDLGTPKVPDLRKILDNFVTELCLPTDMKPFVYSLMHYRRCDFLDIDNHTKKYLLRIPDYECTVMSYILVSIKICFGLDGNYEIKLSDVVDNINLEKDLPKSYKIGKYSAPSNRLFSFREWCSYLQFRKIMLSKYNLRIAEKYSLEVDDYVYLEHMEERPKDKEELSDKISIDIISRLPQEGNSGVIPKDAFSPTLTPLSEYTDVVIDYCQDPDIKMKLAEDFKRYSLKYACENLKLLDSNLVNVIRGVNEDNKINNKVILGNIKTKKAKTTMVYVKNCENRNWLKTNPPTMEHVICDDENEKESNDKDLSDHGYDSEITSKERNLDIITEKQLTDQSAIERNAKNSDQDHNRCENILMDNSLNVQNIISDNDMNDNVAKGITYNVNANKSHIKHKHKSNDVVPFEHEVERNTDENLSDDSEIQEYAKNKETHDNTCERNIEEEDNLSVNAQKDKDSDSIIHKSSTGHAILEKSAKNVTNDDEECRKVIIQEENIDKNIFDDSFEDLTFKEECEQNNVDNLEINEDDTEINNQMQNNDIPDEDFDRRSDISDVIFPTFNPETFNRDSTIKELILHACKKYKIPVPSEYRIKEPRKRRDKMLGTDVPTKRSRTKYEGKASANQLLSDYYNYVQSDFVNKVQQEMSLAIRNADLENQNIQQNDDLSSINNFQVSVIERNAQSGIDTPIARSDADSTIVPINEELNYTYKTDLNDEIGSDLENTLFEDDGEMQIDDVIPKGDPNFDEKIYDTDQLYIRIKQEPDSILEVKGDIEIDKILSKKIEECKESIEFASLEPKPKQDNVKKREESDSEDEIPLSVFKEEKLLVEEMYLEEDKYERLIRKEDIPEIKYWIRHYDRDFMLRSVDWHAKFDEELKENTPTSFYFVIQECASILNCSNFYLYKSMQNLEEYMVNKAKKLNSSTLNANQSLLEISDENIE